jgi:hypothetical protein
LRPLLRGGGLRRSAVRRAERAVVVRGVAGQRYAPGVEPVGDAVMHAEPRAPHDVLHCHRFACGPRASTRSWMKLRAGVGGASATLATIL